MKPDNLLPAELPKPELPDAISDGDADDAARQLGLTFFSARKSKLLRKIGLYQTAQGVIHLGVGRLAAADEALHRLIEASVEIAEDKAEETKVRVDAMSAGKGLIDSLQRSIELVADFQQKKLIGSATPKKRSFVDEQPVVPIQANAGSTVLVSIDSRPKEGQNI